MHDVVGVAHVGIERAVHGQVCLNQHEAFRGARQRREVCDAGRIGGVADGTHHLIATGKQQFNRVARDEAGGP